MKRLLARLTMFIVVLGTFALLAAACGSATTDVGAGTSPDQTTTSTSTTTAPTTAAPTTIPGHLPLGAGPYLVADITVAIHPNGIDTPATANYRLSCLGDTATVSGDAPNSAPQMCLALSQPDARDLLINGAPTDRMCTEIYGGPDVAVFTGRLDGRTIDFTADRVNGCAINDWNTTLGDLLP